jgi:ABC-type Fe3+/spermidine/putrescine transport system ATPase subunit
MGVLELHGLAKKFGSIKVLRDISLQVEPGQIFGLLGESGSGKSTLLRILAGLEQPAGGSILFNGNDVVSAGPAERGFGFISQESSLFPEQSVFENIAFGLKEKGVSPDNVIEKTNEMLIHLGLEDAGRKRPEHLSAGDRLLVALGRALALEPQILLIDSPFGTLDINTREAALETFRRVIKGMGVTTLYAAKDHIEIFALCDRAGLLNNGEIAQTGAPRDLYEHPETVFAAQILGRNNFITSRRISFTNSDIQEFQTLNGDHRLRTDKMENNKLGPITQDVTLAIRPENISISFGASFPEDNLLKAVVKDVRYQGATTRIILDAEGLMLEALVLRLVGLNIFDECLVGLPPDRILVLKD